MALTLELSLRLTVSLWPREIRNLIFKKYGFEPSGIYFVDPRYDIHIMKPNFKQNKMFYNDHWWRHQTNKIGIRSNRDIKEADIVLLGDSMIYGHGINAESTLSYCLEKITGATVANLGVQADYPPYEYIRLKNLGLFLKPKVVLFFVNGWQDEHDFSFYRPTEYYINKLISEKEPDYSKGVAASDYLRFYKKTYPYGAILLDNVVLHKFFCKRKKLSEKLFLVKNIRRNNTQLNHERKKIAIGNIMMGILVDTKRLCGINRAKLIVVFNAIGEPYDFNNICKDICVANDIPYIDLNEKSPKNNYILENDGHYSPDENKCASGIILQYLENNHIIKDKQSIL